MAEEANVVTTTRCPRCQARLTFERLPEPDNWECCPECGVSLQVISVRPLELRWEEKATCYDDNYWP